MPLGSAKLKKLSLVLAIITIVVIFGVPQKIVAQDLIVRVGDTTGSSGEQNSVISVYLTNWEDDIAAFTLWLRLNKPGILEFQTDTMTIIDTTYWVCEGWEGELCTDSVAGNPDTLYWQCIEYIQGSQGDSCIDWILVSADSPYTDIQLPDSPLMVYVDTVVAEIGNIDTTGTLIAGWDYINTRSYSADNLDVKVTAIANVLGGGGNSPIRDGEINGLLFRLLGDIQDISDDDTNRVVDIQVENNALEHFIFSRPDGSAVGVHTQEVPDSNLFRCVSWGGIPYESPCMVYDQVIRAPYDSVEYITDTVAYLDTNEVYVIDGSLTVLTGVCGNCNNDPLDNVDISDITFIISYLYLNGPIPENPALCNVNCSPDGEIDIADITAIISALYLNGHELCSDFYNGGC